MPTQSLFSFKRGVCFGNRFRFHCVCFRLQISLLLRDYFKTLKLQIHFKYDLFTINSSGKKTRGLARIVKIFSPTDKSIVIMQPQTQYLFLEIIEKVGTLELK